MAEYTSRELRAEARKAARRMEPVSSAELERRAAARHAGTALARRRAHRNAVRRMEDHTH